MEGAALFICNSGTIKIIAEAVVDLEGTVNALDDMTDRQFINIRRQVVTAGCAFVCGDYFVLGKSAEYLEGETDGYTGFFRQHLG